ncbi:MAG TPA: hypothetical protein VGY56_09045 [Verrucomicrobiae bacterium]|nr:hypothetical protein [Verrucomicrobiae bacterium]
MRDVIEKVMAAEAEGRRLVEAARKDAEQILANARAERRILLERATRESRLEAENILATAGDEARREKAESLACAADEVEKEIRLDETTRQHLVEAAVRCLRGPVENVKCL